MDEFLYKEETYRIIGACFEVYNEKGCGFLEPVYQECLEIEFGLQGIPFDAKQPLKLKYKERELKKTAADCDLSLVARHPAFELGTNSQQEH